MRITKVYTRTGDQGTTQLVGGRRVSKNSQRLAAYGAVDELNSILGLTRTFAHLSDADGSAKERLVHMLKWVQNRLFDVGAELATPPDVLSPQSPRVRSASVKELEDWIDDLNQDLGPLVEFVLPGGGPVGAYFHQARTVCRRAEREVVAMQHADESSLSPDTSTIIYLNRLSDWLFVAGRWAAKQLAEPEYVWERGETE